MSDEKPCTDCGESSTRAEKMLAVVGLFAGIIIGYMAVDIMTSGRVSAGLGRVFGGRGLGSEAETYLKAAANDRHG